tara:strand:- start:404 stop:2020 length:1617 start_codon:yes stop_codon:yes gene_type:complete
MTVGILNLFFSFNKDIYKNYFRLDKNLKLNIDNFFFYILFILFFLFSFLPITDADSTGYHLFIPKFFIQNGFFPIQSFNYQTYLFGIGEIFNLLFLALDIDLFITLTNFLGLVIILSLIFNFNLKYSENSFYSLLVLSCPIIVPLINTAKPQFFFVSLISILFAIIININKKNYKKNSLNQIFFIICTFGIACYLAKVTFALAYALIILLFFIHIFKNLQLEKFFNFVIIFLLLNILFLLPPILWKVHNFEVGFFNSFFNPIPNIPGADIFVDHVKNYFSKNPLIYLFPLSLSDLTNTFGILLLILPVLFFLKLSNLKEYLLLIVLFILIIFIFGQKSPRFLLEIYFFIIFLFCVSKFKFKFFKLLVYLQSTIVAMILLFGIFTLFPSNFSQNYQKKVFSNHSNGYLLYQWANDHISENRSFLTNHRSIYFSNAKPIFLEFTFFLNKNSINNEIFDFHFKNINDLSPNYILFWGKETSTRSYGVINFENCIDRLIVKDDNVGFHAARNPFTSSKDFYSASIYKLKDNADFKNCTKIKN